MNNKLKNQNVISWIIGILFFAIGVLNFILVHSIPGIFYILLSIIYFPQTSAIIKKKFNISIPFKIKLIIFLGVMWPTLAVGDLAEILGL